MSKTRVVVLVILLALLSFWWAIIHIPSVGTAFWDFCTLGILPWNGKAISQEDLWRALIACFTLSFMIIFRTEIMASFPRRRSATRAKVQKTQSKLAAVHTDKPVPQPVARKRDVIVLTIARSAHRPSRNLLRPILLAAARVCVLFVTIGDVLEKAGVFIGRQVVRYGSAILWALVQLTWRLCLAIATVAMVAWRYLEPHIREFDHWLDVRLHRNSTTASVLRTSNDLWKATSTTYKKLQQTTSKTQQHQ